MYLLSNQKWFKKYLLLRQTILDLVLVVAALMVFPIERYDAVVGWYQVTVLSLLLSLVVFEYVQKPAWFELTEVGGQLQLSLYIPNPKYFFAFPEKHVKTLTIASDDRVTVLSQSSGIRLLQSFAFVIQKNNGTTIKTQFINFGWASSTEIETLKRVIQQA